MPRAEDTARITFEPVLTILQSSLLPMFSLYSLLRPGAEADVRKYLSSTRWLGKARGGLTWLAIFPLVAIGITAMAPFTVGWDPVLRAFVLTLVVVPLAMYLVVPWLMSIHDRYLTPRR